MGDLSKQEAEIKLSGMRQIASEEDPKSSEELLAYKQKEASEIQKSIAYDEAVAKTDFKTHRHPTEVEHEIKSTIEKMALQKQFCESIDIALNALNTAFAQTRKSFGTVLEKRTGEIFEQITSQKYNNLTLSKDFNITAQPCETFSSKEWQYFSSGTADQAYFALRLAVSEILSNDCNGLPILLDDSFAQYDDERIKKALEFLARYSKNNQVIYFTCHKLGLDKYENINKLI